MILLDEVMGGLNARESEEIIQLILDVRKRASTQVVIEHDMKAIVRRATGSWCSAPARSWPKARPRRSSTTPVMAAYLGDSGAPRHDALLDVRIWISPTATWRCWRAFR